MQEVNLPEGFRIVTLKERKETERARRQAAVAVLRARLADYARAQGGRFLLYGSAARGTMRYDSDVDVLVDFPEETKAAAWDYAEEVCRELRLPIDVNYRDWCGAAFLAHIKAVPIP
jgi:predicted nucleotidyltransferase